MAAAPSDVELPSLSTLAARAVALHGLDRQPAPRLAALPLRVKAKLLAEAVAVRMLPDDALASLGGGHEELSLRGSRVSDRGLGLPAVFKSSGAYVFEADSESDGTDWHLALLSAALGVASDRAVSQKNPASQKCRSSTRNPVS